MGPNIIFEFKIMTYEQILAKETCRMGVSTSRNDIWKFKVPNRGSFVSKDGLTQWL